MSDVSARYSRNADGSVRVLNPWLRHAQGCMARCRRQSTVHRREHHGLVSFKVSFFGPFYGGYHVAALDPDYRWALVIGPVTTPGSWRGTRR